MILDDTVRAVLSEFDESEEHFRSLIRPLPDSPTSETEFVFFDPSMLHEPEGLKRVRAALDFLSPTQSDDDDDGWGDYAHFRKPACNSQVFGTTNEALETFNVGVIPELVHDSDLLRRTLKILNTELGHHIPTCFVNALVLECDNAGEHETLVELLEACLSRTDVEMNASCLRILLIILSRRYFQVHRMRRKLAQLVQRVLTETKIVESLRTVDPSLDCLQRWLSCQFATEELKPQQNSNLFPPF